MGIHDRDYNRTGHGMGSPPRSGGQGMLLRSPSWSFNTKIIVVNIAIHLLAITIFASKTGNPLDGAFYKVGSLTVEDGFQRLEVWRLVTFQFLHSPASIWHLGMNMFGLWIFGPMVEQYLGGKKYLAFYLVCGLAGGMLFVILNLLGAYTPINILSDGFKTPLVGASAGVFGIIVACAHIAPNQTVQLLFPPIPMKLKIFAYGYVALSLVQLLGGSNNAGGEAAHMGGAIAGFYFIRNSHHLLDFFDIFGDSRSKSKKSNPFKAPKPKRGVPTAEEIDRILAKVNSSGIHSLTDKEKQTLNKASKDQQNN